MSQVAGKIPGVIQIKKLSESEVLYNIQNSIITLIAFKILLKDRESVWVEPYLS